MFPIASTASHFKLILRRATAFLPVDTSPKGWTLFLASPRTRSASRWVELEEQRLWAGYPARILRDMARLSKEPRFNEAPMLPPNRQSSLTQRQRDTRFATCAALAKAYLSISQVSIVISMATLVVVIITSSLLLLLSGEPALPALRRLTTSAEPSVCQAAQTAADRITALKPKSEPNGT